MKVKVTSFTIAVIACIGVYIFNMYVILQSQKKFDNTCLYTQTLANEEINKIDKNGYLSKDERNLIKGSIENKGVECEVTGTSLKVPKDSTTFISIKIYTTNSWGGKVNTKNVLIKGIAE